MTLGWCGSLGESCEGCSYAPIVFTKVKELVNNKLIRTIHLLGIRYSAILGLIRTPEREPPLVTLQCHNLHF